jgi:hypothetical protein
MILGSSPTLNTRFLSFNRTQSRVVTRLLTGHNTLKRHLHLTWLSCNPKCTRCAAEEEASIHVFCKCDTLAFHSDAYASSFYLDPEAVSIGLGPSEILAKEQGSLNLTTSDYGVQRACLKAQVHQD